MATKKKSAASKSPAPIAMRTIPDAPNVKLPPVPAKSKQRRGKTASAKLAKPTDIQRTVAGDVAVELRAAPEFERDFGRIGVDAAKLADRLDAAATWDRFYTSLAAWAPVARSIRTAAWDAVLRDLKPIAAFLETVGSASDVGGRYPAAVSFFGIRKEVAARGAATRRANKKKAKKDPPAK